MTTEVRELLGDAAQSEVRPDLAERAIGGARTRRRQRLVVGSSVLAAAAVVLGVVIAGGDLRTAREPRPTDVATLPAVLPAPDGLPTLTAGAMDAASAAYVVEGEVVVVDAATGEGAVVDLGPPRSSLIGDEMPSIGPDASLALSPNGQVLLVSSGETSLTERGSEWLWLVNLATGRADEPKLLSLADAPKNSEVAPTRLAWSPDGLTFACTYLYSGTSRPRLFTTNLAIRGDDLVEVSVASYGVAPRQISWGSDGLVVQLDGVKAPWRLVPLGESAALADPEEWPPLESVSLLAPGALQFSAVAMGHSDEGGFLGKLSLGKGVGGELWVVTEDGDDRTVESVPSRPWLGALGDSYFVVLTDWKGDPYNGEVDRVDAEGETTLTTLTTLPAGATTISFASELVD